MLAPKRERVSLVSFNIKALPSPRLGPTISTCHFRENWIMQEISLLFRSQQQEGNSCSDGQLSGVMPDVAMATASFGALHLIEEQELELDLGDGASHLLPHVSPSSGGSIEAAAHRSSLPHQHQRHFSGPPPPPYVYHRAGTALPRFIWNLYTMCGSEQRGNYWSPFAPSTPFQPSLPPLIIT